jgi:hypothetical protein
MAGGNTAGPPIRSVVHPERVPEIQHRTRGHLRMAAFAWVVSAMPFLHSLDARILSMPVPAVLLPANIFHPPGWPICAFALSRLKSRPQSVYSPY